MQFTVDNLAAARTRPRHCSEGMVSAVLDVPVSALRRLRDTRKGPDYITTVGGLTYYRRAAIIAFITANLADPAKVVDR